MRFALVDVQVMAKQNSAREAVLGYQHSSSAFHIAAVRQLH
jgi:hypothetical protein